MTGEIDSIGTAAEGVLYGAAVERAANGGKGDGGGGGSGDDGAPADGSDLCLNCGAALAGPYCSQCGQKRHIHRTLGALWHDILHGVMHFDGKLWRTLPLLAWKPGELTRRYIHGERARFVSPMALFLFAIFLMFAVGAFFGSSGNLTKPNESPFGLVKVMDDDGKPIDPDRIDEGIGTLEKQIDGASITEQVDIAQQIDRLKAQRNAYDMVAGDAPTYPELIADEENETVNANTGIGWLDAVVEKAAHKAKTNPQLLLYKLQSNGYKFAWLLIPLSVPFVWLVTLGARAHAGEGKRRHPWYDHAVFVTYSIAFMSLMYLGYELLTAIGIPAEIPFIAGLLYAPIHIYRHLRRAYGFGRISAFLRFLILLQFIAVVSGAYLLILLLLGVLG